jgi:phytoene synthase
LALLALDTRLAGIVHNSHEPSLAQLRLAWWREQLQADTQTWPRGEPLLGALRSWQGHHPALVALVDGWEYLTGAAPLPETDLAEFALGRGRAFGSLAEVMGTEKESAEKLGRQWALADLAGHVAHPDERETALRLLAMEGRPARVARALRPLTVLHGLAVRRQSAPSLLTALRLGLLGR